MTKLAPHVEAALNELDNAEAHGNDERVKAARKALDAAGMSDREVAAARRSRAAEASGDVQAAREAPPKERTTKSDAKTTTEGKKAE